MSVFYGGRKGTFVQIPNSHYHFSKISRTFFVKIFIPYKTYVREDQLSLAMYGSTTIQSRLFLKNIRNFVCFPKQYLLGFFILEKQFANILDRVFLFLCDTLLLYSLSPYRRTDRQTDRGTNTLALNGLVGPFFQLSVFCSGEK